MNSKHINSRLSKQIERKKREKNVVLIIFQYMSMEAEAGTFMGIECAVTGPDGKMGLLFISILDRLCLC